VSAPVQGSGFVRRLAIVFAGVLVAVAFAVAGWVGYRELVSQPIQRVVFSGDVDRLPHDALDALTHTIQSSPSPSLEAIREAARRVPWVREATVRREFPAGVLISFEAHRAFAHWGEGRMVSVTGDVFSAADAGKLPRLRGPEGTAPAMVQEYASLAKAIAPLADPIAELRLSRRGAWTLVLESGLTLQLGRGPATPRVERFAAAWPQLAASHPDHVDLRYPNGFAVRKAAVLKVTPSAR
jgi:cell division protein FtsQ